jgi:hypothetical protein
MVSLNSYWTPGEQIIDKWRYYIEVADTSSLCGLSADQNLYFEYLRDQLIDLTSNQS